MPSKKSRLRSFTDKLRRPLNRVTRAPSADSRATTPDRVVVQSPRRRSTSRNSSSTPVVSLSRAFIREDGDNWQRGRSARRKSTSSGSQYTVDDDDGAASTETSAESDASSAPSPRRPLLKRVLSRKKRPKKGSAPPADDGGRSSGSTDETGDASEATAAESSEEDASEAAVAQSVDDDGGGDEQADNRLADMDENKTVDLQVRVRIVEAKDLKGDDMDPVCRVFLGKKVRQTGKRSATNSPQWNQTFHFHLQSTPRQLAEKTIEFRVFSKNRLRADTPIGCFSTNAARVYGERRHSVVNRWLALSPCATGDGRAPDAEAVGFLRVSLSVLAPGDRGANLQAPPTAAGKADDAVWFESAAAFQHYTLRVGLFELIDGDALTAQRANVLGRPAVSSAGETSADSDSSILSFLRRQPREQVLAVQVSCGGRSVVTKQLPKAESSSIGQEAFLPITWPTVVKKLEFRLLAFDKVTLQKWEGKARQADQANLPKPSRVVGWSSIALRQICCDSPSHGFLPSHGPAHLTFYGPHVHPRGVKGKQHTEHGSTFCGRLLLDVDCLKQRSTGAQVQAMLSHRAESAEAMRHRDRFVAICSFFHCNMIHPFFRKDNVSFEVSVGRNGNSLYEAYTPTASRTPAVMPIFDGTFKYAMPWGNRKPCSELACNFENFAFRMRRDNFIGRLSCAVERGLDSAIDALDEPPVADSHCAAAAAQLTRTIRSFERALGVLRGGRGWLPGKSVTDLDHLLAQWRERGLLGIASAVCGNVVTGVCLRDFAVRLRQSALRLFDSVGEDAQVNVPDLIVKMFVNRRRFREAVAFARVPAASVFYDHSLKWRGRHCGDVRPLTLQWIDTRRKADSGSSVPAQLHVRLFFALAEHHAYFNHFVESAKLLYYAEVWENQVRHRQNTWTAAKVHYSDEDVLCRLTTEPDHFSLPNRRWRFLDKKFASSTLDLYTDEDTGYRLFQEAIYIYEARSSPDASWEKKALADRNGLVRCRPVGTLPEHLPADWKWLDAKWNVDLHRPCDPDGYTYGTEERIDGRRGCLAIECCPSHTFRCRRLVRRRRRVEPPRPSAPGTDAALVLSRLQGDPEGWQYMVRLRADCPSHLKKHRTDNFRRRRLLRPLEAMADRQRDTPLFADLFARVQPVAASSSGSDTDVDPASAKAANKKQLESVVDWAKLKQRNAKLERRLQPGGERVRLPFRMYVDYGLLVPRYVMHAYLMQGRDLLPVSRRGVSSPYCRVYFGDQGCESLCVLDKLNPVWNETLVLRDVPIVGSPHRLAANPPSVVVEVFSQTDAQGALFLGRFSADVVVQLREKRDRRPPPLQWHALQLGKEKFRGSLLVAFEIFNIDDKDIRKLPNKKAASDAIERFALPSAIVPEMATYYVSFACLGVRNLRRHGLKRIRTAFVEVTAGDERQRTDARDLHRSPNFEQPLLSLPATKLPRQVKFAPPICLTLFECAAFGRQSPVGVCLVSRFAAYITEQPTVAQRDAHDKLWRQLESQIRAFDKEVFESGGAVAGDHYVASSEFPASEHPELDWWSKFYASEDKNTVKSPGYLERGLETLVIHDGPLEEVAGYNGFNDFAETFELHKVTRGRQGNPEYANCVGELKGRLRLYRNPTVEPTSPRLGMRECVVRVYVIRAMELSGSRRSGRCDPYVEVRCGKAKAASRRSDYKTATCEPLFGQLFELSNVRLPQDSELRVTLRNHRLIRITADAVIGSTTIDMENRLLTKHRATVGLAAQYNRGGPTAWRDQQRPVHILRDHCKSHDLPPPVFVQKDDSWDLQMGGKTWSSNDEPSTQVGAVVSPYLGAEQDCLALRALRSMELVAEHVETRPLFGNNENAVEGKVQLFVDLFPRDLGPIPPPLDIAPRRPRAYQLRLVVWNLRGCRLTNRLMGETSADLYVKCFLGGQNKSQKTDVHYRSLDGDGAFNYRMVFNFDFDFWERKFVDRKRRKLFKHKTEELLPPQLVVQVWDNNKFRRDSYVGQVSLDLLKAEEGQLDDSRMCNVSERKRRWCRRLCCAKLRKSKQSDGEDDELPFYLADVAPRRSLFEQRRARGWWPCTASEQGDGDGDGEQRRAVVTAKVELQMELLTRPHADKDPVGRARHEPNRNPFLSKPSRPRFESWWLTSRMKACNKLICKRYWPQILLTCVLVVVVLVIVSFVIQAPSIAVDEFRQIVF